MPERIRALLEESREDGVFSAAAWSYGSTAGPVGRGLTGTLSWGGGPVAEESRWDLASLTKPIVALVVMSLVDSGELTLDDTLSDHLDEYRGTDKARITVRDLLTHTSGLPGQVPFFRTSRTPEELLAALRALPLLAAPGEDVVYSSAGFILLGLVAESASRLPLDELLRQRVLDPVGMDRTSFGLPVGLRAEAVATEDDPWRGRVVQGEVHDENAVVLGRPAGHAGLFSTLADLEALCAVLCARGRVTEGRALLSPAGFRKMIAPRTDHLGSRRALGWQGVDRSDSPAGDLVGPLGFGHTGFTGTSIWIDPEPGRYVVLLTNRVHPSREGPSLTRVRRRVNNLGFAAML